MSHSTYYCALLFSHDLTHLLIICLSFYHFCMEILALLIGSQKTTDSIGGKSDKFRKYSTVIDLDLTANVHVFLVYSLILREIFSKWTEKTLIRNCVRMTWSLVAYAVLLSLQKSSKTFLWAQIGFYDGQSTLGERWLKQDWSEFIFRWCESI